MAGQFQLTSKYSFVEVHITLHREWNARSFEGCDCSIVEIKSFLLSYFTRVELSSIFHVFLFVICWIIVIWVLDCPLPMVHFQRV